MGWGVFSVGMGGMEAVSQSLSPLNLPYTVPHPCIEVSSLPIAYDAICSYWPELYWLLYILSIYAICD